MSFQHSNNIVVTRSINPNREATPLEKLPFWKCCPGVWIEAFILIIIVIGLVIGFFWSLRVHKD